MSTMGTNEANETDKNEPAAAGSDKPRAADGAEADAEPSQQEHHNPTTEEDTASGGAAQE